MIGTYRMIRENYAEKVGGFYTAGEYDLAPMIAAWPKGTRYLELGRSCILKAYRSRTTTMQLLWRGLMTYVAHFSSDLMFGCASFSGTDPKALALPLSYLHHYCPMPPEVRVRARPELYTEMNLIPKDEIDVKQALRALPPIIKGYLRAGCLIGEGAFIDHQFGTTSRAVLTLAGVISRLVAQRRSASRGEHVQRSCSNQNTLMTLKTLLKQQQFTEQIQLNSTIKLFPKWPISYKQCGTR